MEWPSGGKTFLQCLRGCKELFHNIFETPQLTPKIYIAASPTLLLLIVLKLLLALCVLYSSDTRVQISLATLSWLNIV